MLPYFNNPVELKQLNNLIDNDTTIVKQMFRKQLIKSSVDLVIEINSGSFNTRVIRLSNTSIDGEPIQKIYIGADPEINLIYLAIVLFI